jgi:outer membrane protein assembly factor BamD (BamD/ComL family)
MLPIRYTFTAILFLILCQVSFPSFCQLGIPLTIEKPKEYEDRVLRSEKSDQKKFNVPRRFIQNTVTHYNYFFNANNKLNEVLERAKTSFKDDYSQLLPFYNYSLDVTAKDSIQLDSITYKASTGIALHDLRNDWVDNLYLLWGASFYLRKEFDSAYLMFQFMNYAFAPKEKDGYYLTIGSHRDGNSALSIATKEKNSLPRKVFSEPPSRNDAFIWQIRNFLAQDQFPEAASLIITLKNDPVFPKRLQNDLHEVQALWFYKQNIWDSAAVHLVEALSNATNQQEKARWEYLAAQLFELAGNYKDAEKYYGKVSTHTTDLILDIYARLASIRVNKDGGEKSIDKNISELLKMAKRDKYEEYRDIIYYMAAQMQLEAKNIDGAIAMLLKSTQYTSNNPEQRNKVFLQLAELSFTKQQYRQAYNFYDSLDMNDPTLKNPDAIEDRKKSLGSLATNIEIIQRQDSLQRLASMTEDERKEFVKKLVKQLRRQQGLKDEGIGTGPSANPFPTQPPTNLFGNNTQKGEWYFYNTSSRTLGINQFKAKWGNRPNTDNWRRSSTIAIGTQTQNNQPGVGNTPGNDQNGGEITFEGLYANIPLTPEQQQRSNDSIQDALYELGRVYIEEIENCSAGTETYEQLRSRFPTYSKIDEVLFKLYYCYNKNGEKDKAEAIKKLMSEKFPGSNYTTILTTGKDPKSRTANSEATRTYEDIYDLFVEGNFQEAIAKKNAADSIYGNNYWTPQLLYIEAVYFIKQRDDSSAKRELNGIISRFPNTPLANKATTMLDVLSRRKQIEEELTNLVVKRAGDDSSTTQPINPPVSKIQPKKDSVVKTQPTVITPKPKTDTIAANPPPKVNSPYSFNAGSPHYVVLILNKVDPVFSNEAKNAFFRYNRETFYNKTYTLDLFQLDADNRLLLIAPFKTAQEAVDYVDKTRPKTASEIIPWLKGGKYSFSIISDSNYELLKSNKDIETYKAFLNQQFPGKF